MRPKLDRQREETRGKKYKLVSGRRRGGRGRGVIRRRRGRDRQGSALEGLAYWESTGATILTYISTNTNTH